jgi:hypothetical protein
MCESSLLASKVSWPSNYPHSNFKIALEKAPIDALVYIQLYLDTLEEDAPYFLALDYYLENMSSDGQDFMFDYIKQALARRQISDKWKLEVVENFDAYEAVENMPWELAIRDNFLYNSFPSKKGLRVEELYEEAYSEVYQSGLCGRNIRIFLQWLESASDFNIDRARVLTLFSRNRSGENQNFRPHERRGGFPSGDETWSHHVVLDYNGRIYDFDIAGGPMVYRRASYFRIMFSPEERQSMYGRYIPARAYKRNFNTIGGKYASDDRVMEQQNVDAETISLDRQRWLPLRRLLGL